MLFALLAGLLPKLPAPLKFGLSYLGVESYLNAALEKYKNFETKKKKDDAYKER